MAQGETFTIDGIRPGDYTDWIRKHAIAGTEYAGILSSCTSSIGYSNMALSGTKHVVVCNGNAVDCDDLEKAQAKAEQLAHQHQTEAFILKPIRKVAPKRDVVTTDL